MTPQTLFQLTGRAPEPPRLADATLVLIDYQNEYLEGPLRLHGVEAAVEKAARLLDAARKAGTRIVHVAHRGSPGGLFDRTAGRGAIVDRLAPLATEPVVEKVRPNSFSGTDLSERIVEGSPLIIAGLMTHHCVSSTVRAALDLGYGITVAGDACATRNLPLEGSIVPAETLHRAELAALADRHALVTDVETLTGGA
ncbi:Streptothricin hydrolase [Hartmannibacter diazotrophicus]|uniref:Streptothricin hydrolase n=1 Tax=Hartmannibacter diazotrophicus TaxID=1482074 RepID=A0A2C9D0T1_9HYPH|nr:cysteine hydrolase family protein [Hartmannibacter diazotrophicus]SON53799.1 Streptothricin hydrolase [Hartmannibacter diazotrophicus]